MNGIEKITERIAADSEAEISALNARTKKQADSIYAGYQAAADDDFERTVAAGKVEAEERTARLSSVADLEARKLKLQARQEMLDKAFALAAEKLLALPQDQYIGLLVKLAVNACATGSEALILSDDDRPAIGEAVVAAVNARLSADGKPAAVTLADESRPFRGGLYVASGKVESNCTFDTLVRLERESMALEVAGILFN